MSGPLIGAILTGGQSRRFGSDKALADAGGIPMAARVAAALREAGLDPVVAAGGTAGAELGLVTIPDRSPGAGPLAALASLLSWAGRGGVVVVPCDLPLLKAHDVRAIAEAWCEEPSLVAVAEVQGVHSVSLACWPAHSARRLQVAVDQGQSRFTDGLTIVGANPVPIEGTSLLDADDAATLGQLLEYDGDESGTASDPPDA